MIMVWWAVSARKWFKGPKVNVQHLMLGRDVEGADVLVGEDVGGGEGEERGVVVDGKAAEVAQDGKY